MITKCKYKKIGLIEHYLYIKGLLSMVVICLIVLEFYKLADFDFYLAAFIFYGVLIPYWYSCFKDVQLRFNIIIKNDVLCLYNYKERFKYNINQINNIHFYKKGEREDRKVGLNIITNDNKEFFIFLNIGHLKELVDFFKYHKKLNECFKVAHEYKLNIHGRVE